MHSKKFRRRVLPITMAAIMVASCFPAMAANDAWSIGTSNVLKGQQIKVSADKTISVDVYTDSYLDASGKLTDAQFDNARVNIYVPSNATADSPIIYFVNNSGWFQNSYTAYNEGDVVSADMSTASGKSALAADALEDGYVVVTAGLRTRQTVGKGGPQGQIDENGEYYHAPVTVADAKAVIRYLRHNEALGLLPAGDTDKIIITGHSGGGALSVAIGANGNSSDFYEDLFEIGAAGITKGSDGTYTSTLADDVLGVVAYSPITDLGHSDGSYEYTYTTTRDSLLALDENPTDNAGLDANALSPYSIEVSAGLAKNWATDYASKLNLKDENGQAFTFGENLLDESTFNTAVKDLLIATMQKGLDANKGDADAFYAQLALRDFNPIQKAGNGSTIYDEDGNPVRKGSYADSGVTVEEITNAVNVKEMVTVENGKVTDLDVDMYLLYVAGGETLKNAPAFDNQGTTNTGGKSENNLWGTYGTTGADMYGHVVKEAYDSEDPTSAFYAKYNATMDWNTYWDTYGDTLSLQMRMANSIDYLLDNEGSDKGDSATYWYVRHGVLDRDTSFANQTLLYYTLLNDGTIKDENVNFSFGWLYAHNGYMDVDEAGAWIDTIVEKATPDTNNQGGTTTPPATDNDGKDDGKSPQTGATSGMLPMVIASIAAVAGASVRGRKLR